jgi:hypothetical protein
LTHQKDLLPFTAHFFLIPITQNGIRMKTWWQNSGFMASYGIHIIKSYQIHIKWPEIGEMPIFRAVAPRMI